MSNLQKSYLSTWKQIKRSGAFRRKIKKCYKNIVDSEIIGEKINLTVSEGNPDKQNVFRSTVEEPTNSNDSAFIQEVEMRSLEEQDASINNWELELDECNEEMHSNLIEAERNIEFRKSIRLWAVSFNVPHVALKALFQRINSRFRNTLPQDPRTLLKTYQTVLIRKVGNGSYWHHGFELSLRQIFAEMSDILNKISINVNMDGLPIFKSSKLELWPILFNIYEIPNIKPMIIGIYCGKGKPSDLSAYLQPFVEEAKILLEEGLHFSNKVINIKLRCFICDSPARAFIKGRKLLKIKLLMKGFFWKCIFCRSFGRIARIALGLFCRPLSNNVNFEI